MKHTKRITVAGLVALLGLICFGPTTAIAGPPQTETETETETETAATPVAGPPALGELKGTYVLTHAKILVGDGSTIADGYVHVADGEIVAVGPMDGAPAPEKMTTYDLAGAILSPGIIAADTSLGVVEIDLEASTRNNSREDGQPIRAGYDPAPSIHADSSLIQIQAIEGITTAAVAPSGGLLSGQVAWIDLLSGDYTAMVAARGVAIDGSLGQHTGSRAAALAKLEEALADAKAYRRNKAAFDRGQSRTLVAHPNDLAALAPLLDGKVPLTMTAHRAGDILALIELAERWKIKLVLVGASEAWKVAEALAKAKVTVIIQPSKNLPLGFDRLGATLDNAKRLHEAGVSLVIARPGDAHNVRNITQEAGIAVAYGLPADVALRAITLGAAEAYGMDKRYGSIAPKKVANLVVWDGDPLELSSFPVQVFIRGRAIEMRSRQTLLRERYQDLAEFQ